MTNIYPGGLTEGFLLDLANKAKEEFYANFPQYDPNTVQVIPEAPTKTKTVYIAGPMRGYPEFNFMAFLNAGEYLEDWGYTVLSPAENDLENGFSPWGLTGNETLDERDFDLIEALKWDMNAVLDADAIYMLKGWENSKGALAEFALAEAAGKEILYEEGALACTREDEDPSLAIQLASQDNLPEGSVGAAQVFDNPNTGEVRVTSSTGGQKGTKPARLSLLPTEALLKIAEHYGKGAEKYSAHNWRKGYAWSLSYDALTRHLLAFWGGEDIDPETGSPHLAAVAFHVLTLLTFMDEQPDFDDRFSSVGAD